MDTLEILRKSELFSGLSKRHLDKIVDYCRSQSYGQGSIIFCEGDPADELFLLVEGRVILELDVCPVESEPVIPTAIEAIEKNGTFGWSAIVEPYTYTLSARCLTNCNVLTIKGIILRNLMAEDTILGFEVMKRMAKIISLRLLYTRMRLTSGIGIALIRKEVKTLS